MPHADHRYEILAQEVGRAFDAIRERNRSAMGCRVGCTDCCRGRLSITHVEAAYLRRGLVGVPRSVRQELSRRAADESREMCPALDPNGRCQIHAFRPLVCRSYGAPLRYRPPVSIIGPPVIDVCDKNFAGIDTSQQPDEDILDQTDLNDRLTRINEEYCAALGLAADERIPIAHVLAERRDNGEICDKADV